MNLHKGKVEGEQTEFTATLLEKGQGVLSYGVITENEKEAREKILAWAKSHGYEEEDFV